MTMNFVAQPLWRRTPWAVMALVAIGLLGSADALWRRHGLLRQRDAAVSQIDARVLANIPQRPGQGAPADPKAIEAVEQLAVALQRPWEPMLDALQGAVRDDVSITRVQSEVQSSSQVSIRAPARAPRLRVSGRADSGQAFLDFVQRLKSDADASWKAVDPLSEAQQPDAAPGGKPVAFQLSLEWARP